MWEFAEKNPKVIVVVAALALLLLGWQIWANFFRGSRSNLPSGAPAFGGRSPGPMGGVIPSDMGKGVMLPGRGTMMPGPRGN